MPTETNLRQVDHETRSMKLFFNGVVRGLVEAGRRDLVKKAAVAAAVVDEGASSGGPKVDRYRDQRCSAVEKLRWVAFSRCREVAVGSAGPIRLLRRKDFIKPRNFRLHKNFTPKVSNLGHAKLFCFLPPIAL
ncbi:hypothetical protein RHMOL_Rhmol03G0229300 [Rhododendron molle]|uniref:Uncharacterized protein n=1 Tax=Rhododendron molle TaxID=49168 RepID=A0ACC0PHP6_RHOML|nr:hypothetical protein RHMOL_Rhmol03G0229300 [Rhododendron molle]